jgi:hypothetical protein
MLSVITYLTYSVSSTEKLPSGSYGENDGLHGVQSENINEGVKVNINCQLPAKKSLYLELTIG